MLSVPRTETVRGVSRQSEELERAKSETAALRRRLLEMKIAGMTPDGGDLVIFEQGLTGEDLRRLADAGADRCAGVCAAFSGMTRRNGDCSTASGCAARKTVLTAKGAAGSNAAARP